MTREEKKRKKWVKQRAEWAKAHPEEVKARKAAWHLVNREKNRARGKAWHEANKEKVYLRQRAKKAEWAKAHPEEVLKARMLRDAARIEKKRANKEARMAQARIYAAAWDSIKRCIVAKMQAVHMPPLLAAQLLNQAGNCTCGVPPKRCLHPVHDGATGILVSVICHSCALARGDVAT